MEDKLTQSAHLARVISRVTNPCILSVLMLLSIACTESGNVRALVVWVAVLLSFLVILPLVYVYMRISRGGSSTKLVSNPTTFLKQHPRDILILGVLSGLPCVVILVFLEAPLLLLITLIALLASSLVVAVLNIFYRVSYHSASVTILVIMAALTWDIIFLVLLVAIPLIGWAKYQLYEHNPTQLATGVALSVAVIVTTSYLLGLTPIINS